MKKFMLMLLCFHTSASVLAADPGLVIKSSRYSFADTISKIENVLKAKGLVLFAKIDHSGEAAKAGLKMRPTQLLIFGNPKAGTLVMNASPTAAIDLPLKALVAEDENGKVSVTINSPAYLQARHGIKDDLVKNISGAAPLIDLALE